MQEGVASAYGAVMKPAEGTVLTVSRLAAKRAVEAAEENDDVDFILAEAIRVGYDVLAQTTDMNPVVKKAGVVDAGGKGYLVILEGMLASLQRECMENDVSAEDDIAGIILDLDCNEERARQLRELLCQEEYAHYKAFASNPCFEVWFVAHFHELRGTYSGSSQVLEDLRRQLPDYDKGRDCYRKLKDHTQEAIERCKAKERQYKDRNWPSTDCNPRTDVASLVEMLAGRKE